MSMTRNNALACLAVGGKFKLITAWQVLAADGVSPAFRAGLAVADIAFFKKHKDLPAQKVAQACLRRGRYANPRAEAERG